MSLTYSIITDGSRPSSASSSIAPSYKPVQEEYQEGSLLDHLQHYSWVFSTDTSEFCLYNNNMWL